VGQFHDTQRPKADDNRGGRAIINGMPKRSSKAADLNSLAAAIVLDATKGEPEAEVADPPAAVEEKDPAAVSLGRRGGLKGGHARAAALTTEERSAIAKAAAKARWSTKIVRDS